MKHIKTIRELKDRAGGKTNKEPLSDLAKKKIMILVGLLIVGIGLAVFIYINKSGSGTGKSDSSGASIASFIPIWIAIFIPIIVAQKKNKKELSKNRKMLLMALVGLTVLLVLGTIIFISSK